MTMDDQTEADFITTIYMNVEFYESKFAML